MGAERKVTCAAPCGGSIRACKLYAPLATIWSMAMNTITTEDGHANLLQGLGQSSTRGILK
jgi:hypothetical protein